MSKMNAVRIINLNYNNNGIRIDDETFHLNGESSLLSLRNGGGKSVLVQMMIAPFVHKRYRDIKDRKFSSYFTTNKPTFILIEWVLDGGASYVLTGMMVRKHQDTRDDLAELEMFQLIHEYKKPNAYDIHNIPIIDDSENEKKLKNFSSCKQLFENLKNDHRLKFYLYDMNNQAHSSNYYDKLSEYQIYYKEWESIIKKINLKESGLSELFDDVKDETKLMDKWFLAVVEDKLNKDKNRITEFQSILIKYIKQYKENKSKITQNETIKKFKVETLVILTAADSFKESLEDKVLVENKIVQLISQLKKNHEGTKVKLSEIDKCIAQIEEAILEINYAKYSYDIYNLIDQKSNFEQILVQQCDAIDHANYHLHDLSRRMNIQQCAKIYEEYQESYKEVRKYENQLEIIKEYNKDFEPERNSIGYTLKRHYIQSNDALIVKVANYEQLFKENNDKIKVLNDKVEDDGRKLNRYNNHLGELKQKVLHYDEIEEKYNRHHNDHLRRNILGNYEEGQIEEVIKDNQTTIQNKELNVKELEVLEGIKKEEKLSCQQEIDILLDDFNTNGQEISRLKDKLTRFETELNDRKKYIKHINFSEDNLFETENILNTFQKKMNTLDDGKKELQKQYDASYDEFKRLESGRVLELPNDFKEALDQAGIQYTYGMEWLKRNNKSPEDNQLIVKNNPFIPYGLIMSDLELNRLESKEITVFTSSPIPIIKRSSLEIRDAKDHTPIQDGNKVNFYVLFNHNLLDVDELKRLLTVKEKQLDELMELINRKNEEIDFYTEKYHHIKSQEVNLVNYNQVINQLSVKKAENDEIKEKINSKKTLVSELEEFIAENKSRISNEKQLIMNHKIKINALQDLNVEYHKYLKALDEKAALEVAILGLGNEIKNDKQQITNLQNSNQNLISERSKCNNELKEVQNQLTKYSHYSSGEVLNKNIEDLIIRYEELTKEIDLNQKNIEEQLQTAKQKFSTNEKKLSHKSKQYELNIEDYQNETYDPFIEENLETSISEKRDNIDKLKELKRQTQSNIDARENEINLKFQTNLNEKLGKTDLMPRDQIIVSDFDKLISHEENELNKIKVERSRLNDNLQMYEDNISILKPYDNHSIKHLSEFNFNLEFMKKDELERIRVNLIRDYEDIKQQLYSKKYELDKNIYNVQKLNEFQDVFFKKPLSTLSLMDEPNEVINQLKTTIRAYDDLATKLLIDIDMIEKERESVVEMILEYIEDIHKNLDKIDKNSSIKIREKSIKMLRINLPNWEEHEQFYENKLKDVIDDLTENGCVRLENNENIDELVGSHITSKNLYSTIVGMGNIDIKLYKIEAEREYQISWKDVSINSGGEGFLSAFVILSSLLSFMRRDDTDIFAEYEEGKVIVMDNPFAQTNASHLLKPLMDIAKRSNTQLICLTGLGGESIYNRFDNIYVLNLISSNLRKGMQYLKSDHLKGKEPVEIMVSSQVKTEDAEQISFDFND
jgi:hypothetical protein